MENSLHGSRAWALEPCHALCQWGRVGTLGVPALSPLLWLQDSASKLEENVHYFGRTVETLLLRFGKVAGPCRPRCRRSCLGLGGWASSEVMFYQCPPLEPGRGGNLTPWGVLGRQGWLWLPVPGTTERAGWEPLLGNALQVKRLPAFD